MTTNSSDNQIASATIPYYLGGYPVIFDEPSENWTQSKDSKESKPARRVYWAASLPKGPGSDASTMFAGHTTAPIDRVHRFLQNAGYVEILISHDVGDVALIVEELREAFRAGRRADAIKEE